MKILFLHPYGQLGDWNYRIKKQIELMKEKCELRVESIVPGNLGFVYGDVEKIRWVIKDWKPDLVYVNGYLFEIIVRDLKIPVVYDMGSFFSRNILINQYGYDVEEMLKIPDKELVWKLENSNKGDYYRKERNILKKAKAIVVWDSREILLMKKLFGDSVQQATRPVQHVYFDAVSNIPFDKKKDRILAIASKWGDKDKNLGLLNQIRKEIDIFVVGHDGDEKFLNHDKLMELVDDSKVLFCPFKAGGCNVVMDSLRLGCNVVTMDYFPFNTYINDNLIGNKKNIVEKLKLALKEYYPPKQELWNKEKSINTIIEICQSSA